MKDSFTATESSAYQCKRKDSFQCLLKLKLTSLNICLSNTYAGYCNHNSLKHTHTFSKKSTLRQQSGRAKRHTHSCVFLLRPPPPKARRRGGRQFFQ